MYPHRVAMARIITRRTQWVVLSVPRDHPRNGYAMWVHGSMLHTLHDQRDLTGNDKPLFIIFIFPATHYCRLCLMDYNSTCPRLSTTLHELSTALSTTQLPPPDPLTVRFARHRPEASASQIYFGARRKRCWRWKSLRWRCRWCSRRWRCRR